METSLKKTRMKKMGLKGTWILLCAYGLFKELRPSEPFLTEYLEGHQWANLTSQQVNHEVYPVWVYSYLALLVPVFLLTDFIKYKPLIVLEGVAYVACWIMLIFGKTVFEFQMMEFVYGIATSTEVAYYTYIYAVAIDDKQAYQKLTSRVRAAVLFGRFLSGVVSQVTVTLGWLDYYQLNFVSLTSVSLCLLLSCSLPRIKHSLYFHRRKETNEQQTPEGSNSTPVKSSARAAIQKMAEQVQEVFRDSDLALWCLWWSVATSATILVGNNIQPLWEQIYPSTNDLKKETIYNGIVEAIHTFLSNLEWTKRRSHCLRS